MLRIGVWTLSGSESWFATHLGLGQVTSPPVPSYLICNLEADDNSASLGDIRKKGFKQCLSPKCSE